jgi:hypothetical protein
LDKLDEIFQHKIGKLRVQTLLCGKDTEYSCFSY